VKGNMKTFFISMISPSIIYLIFKSASRSHVKSFMKSICHHCYLRIRWKFN